MSYRSREREKRFPLHLRVYRLHLVLLSWCRKICNAMISDFSARFLARKSVLLRTQNWIFAPRLDTFSMFSRGFAFLFFSQLDLFRVCTKRFTYIHWIWEGGVSNSFLGFLCRCTRAHGGLQKCWLCYSNFTSRFRVRTLGSHLGLAAIYEIDCM